MAGLSSIALDFSLGVLKLSVQFQTRDDDCYKSKFNLESVSALWLEIDTYG